MVAVHEVDRAFRVHCTFQMFQVVDFVPPVDLSALSPHAAGTAPTHHTKEEYIIIPVSLPSEPHMTILQRKTWKGVLNRNHGMGE